MNGSELNIGPAFVFIGYFILLVAVMFIAFGWRIRKSRKGMFMLFNSIVFSVVAILFILNKFITPLALLITVIIGLILIIISVGVFDPTNTKKENDIQ